MFSFRSNKNSATSSTAVGSAAEEKVAKYLSKRGHKVVCRNWKNKFCEIDIITSISGTIFFTEVKYRSNLDHGGGLDYVTEQKLRQMSFAAEYWVAENCYSGEYVLAAAEVSGGKYESVSFIEI